jgi:putative membrane protein
VAAVKETWQIFLKGVGMGAANVIPGVSGGTVAFITGIFERLIDALKAFGPEAFGSLFRGRFAAFAKQTDLGFLLALGAGILTGILSLAKVLKWGFAHHPILVWSFFFGLIAASVPFVARLVKRWHPGTVLGVVAGAAVAVSMVFLGRAEENASPLYLVFCGVVSVCAMILPGLSGSFVLLLLGNYELIMLDSVNQLRTDPVSALKVLLPVVAGSVVGLAAFARFLSWLFAKHHDAAVSVIAGFIGGSLAIIWPWKDSVVAQFERDGEIKTKVTGFENWRLPDFASSETWIALALLALGAGLVVVMELVGRAKPASVVGAAVRSQDS